MLLNLPNEVFEQVLDQIRPAAVIVSIRQVCRKTNKHVDSYLPNRIVTDWTQRMEDQAVEPRIIRVQINDLRKFIQPDDIAMRMHFFMACAPDTMQRKRCKKLVTSGDDDLHV